MTVAAEQCGPCGPVAQPLFELCGPGPPTFGITSFCFCFALISPLIIDFFEDWPTHFQNSSAAAD